MSDTAADTRVLTIPTFRGRETVYVPATVPVEANELQQLMTPRTIEAFVNVILCAFALNLTVLRPTACISLHATTTA
jgi:hypothetical protein